MPYHQWIREVIFTALTVLLIAFGVTDKFGLLTIMVIAAVFTGAGIFLWLFPGSRFFVLSFANSLAIYTCVYFFLAIENFPTAEPWAFVVGYLLPIFAFLFGAWWHRKENSPGRLRRSFGRPPPPRTNFCLAHPGVYLICADILCAVL